MNRYLRFAQQPLLGALLVDLVVAGGHRLLHFERLVEFIVVFDAHADQLGVGRPDHRAVQGIHRGQQNVRQVLDMIEKLDARSGAGARIDIGIGVVLCAGRAFRPWFVSGVIAAWRISAAPMA